MLRFQYIFGKKNSFYFKFFFADMWLLQSYQKTQEFHSKETLYNSYKIFFIVLISAPDIPGPNIVQTNVKVK